MKNQSKQAQKIAQKRAAKAKQRKAENKNRSHQPAPVGKKFTFPSEREFNFWRAHGINFILSDYDNVTWMPMFNIYDGENPPDLNTTAKMVMDKFGPDSGDWPPEGRAALGWAVSAPATLGIYYMEAKRRVLEKYPDETIEDHLHAPHNPVVWELFNYLKSELASKTA